MTTFYLDPDDGNDANDGATFANRWKTIAFGPTAARVAAGDVIRVIASPDPTSPGDATWTDNSGTITWAANKNLVVDDCETNWTAETNITSALSTARKQGSNCVAITPASAFTTGKMAYRTLPATLDLSAFEQISFWFRFGAVITAGALELKLCSDSLGNTAVHTIPIPAGVSTSQWRAVVHDFAGAMDAAINSISLWATTDPSVTAMRIDNIMACKAASSADCVTLHHVIGKNTGPEPEWYAIGSIAADGVVIGGAHSSEVASAGAIPRPYRGTTETVATYLLRGFRSLTAFGDRTLADGGTEAAPITLTGGWNRTDMSTQTGASYFNGQHAQASAIRNTSQQWWNIEKIGAFYMTTVAYEDTNSSSGNMTVSMEQIVGCVAPATMSANRLGMMDLTFTQIHGCAGSITIGGAATAHNAIVAKIGRLHGGAISAANAALNLGAGRRYHIGKIDNHLGYGCSSGALTLPGSFAEIVGCTFANNAAADIFLDSQPGDVRLINCVHGEMAGNVGSSSWRPRLISINNQGVAGSHKIYNRYWTAEAQTAVRHTASGIAWSISPTSTTITNSRMPAAIPLAKIACKAGTQVDFKVWCRRTNTGLSLGVRLQAGELPGVGDSDITSLMSAAADTWEQITLSFTPTMAGVVEILGIAYGGTTYTGYFDDQTVEQA